MRFVFLANTKNLISQLSCGVCSGQEERENRNLFSLSVGLAAVSLEDPTGQQRQEEQGERKIYLKKKSESESDRKEMEWLCNRMLVMFQIRLLYSDAGGEWFQAADNGPTGSILTFSLVIAELAG